jgi:hypothetical protein
VNELEKMCSEVRPIDPDVLANGRRRLQAAAIKNQRARRPRLLLTGAAAVTGVAVVVGAVAVAGTGSGTHHAPAKIAVKTTAPALPEIKLVSAVQVLHLAASAAGKERDLNPRNDQFIVIKETDGRGGTGETWHSEDGSKNDISYSNSCLPHPMPSFPCYQSLGKAYSYDTPAYYRTLPTTPAALTAWLDKTAPPDMRAGQQTAEDKAAGKDPNQYRWKTIEDMVSDNYLPPKLRAAMYAVLSKIPGVSLVGNVTDPYGRKGVAVTMAGRGGEQMVFDRRTFAFLGVRGTDPGKKSPTWDSVVLSITVADSAPPSQTLQQIMQSHGLIPKTDPSPLSHHKK